jgi:hypothetical protein
MANLDWYCHYLAVQSHLSVAVHLSGSASNARLETGALTVLERSAAVTINSSALGYRGANEGHILSKG